MEKVKIDNPKEYQATTGEVLELHFRILSLPFISKWQIAEITKRINRDPHTKVLKTDVIDNTFIVTIKIVDNPFPLAIAIIGVSTVLGTFFIMNSLGSVYKIVETPQGAILSTGALLAALAGIFAFLKIRK